MFRSLIIAAALILSGCAATAPVEIPPGHPASPEAPLPPSQGAGQAYHYTLEPDLALPPALPPGLGKTGSEKAPDGMAGMEGMGRGSGHQGHGREMDQGGMEDMAPDHGKHQPGGAEGAMGHGH